MNTEDKGWLLEEEKKILKEISSIQDVVIKGLERITELEEILDALEVLSEEEEE